MYEGGAQDEEDVACEDVACEDVGDEGGDVLSEIHDNVKDGADKAGFTLGRTLYCGGVKCPNAYDIWAAPRSRSR